MSRTISPAESSSHSAGQESPKLLNKVLRVDVRTESASKGYMACSIEKLSGTCPKDVPLWMDHTTVDHDARSFSPYTIRYTSTEHPSTVFPLMEQKHVRKAICRQIEQVLRNDELSGALPTILFDELPTGADTSLGVLDLVFNSFKALDAVRELLKELDITHSGDHKSTYKIDGCTNSLNGDIFIVECFRLPIDTIDVRELHDALTLAFASAGEILGIGKIVVDSKEWGKSYSGIIRFYIKLHRENMSIAWDSLVLSLPTHLSWYGLPYSLSYAGRRRHKKHVFSADFPAVEASASKRGRTEGEPADSTSSTAKKARSTE